MMIEDTYRIQKIKLLGTLRVIIVQEVWEAFWADKAKTDAVISDLEDRMEGIKLLCNSLGIDVSKKDIFSTKFDFNRPVTSFIESCLSEDPLNDRVEDLYGKKNSFIFSLTQILCLVRLISSIFRHNRKILNRKIPNRIKEEKNRAIQMMQFAGDFISENSEIISTIFGSSFSRKCTKLASLLLAEQINTEKFVQIYQVSESPINELYPNYGLLLETLDRSKMLIRELNNCPPGQKYWKQYEDTCVKILRFLFVPPFKRVMVQVRTADGHEKRDVVLPNNQYSDFWQMIREEFESRHVICECKNEANVTSKEALHQLRIYLSKPTIGRFGLLFIRKPPRKSLLNAQRDAYEQSRILILILDDEKVQELLKAKAYIGFAEEVLETEKTLFEVDY